LGYKGNGLCGDNRRRESDRSGGGNQVIALDHIPLAKAIFCPDCSSIIRNTGACPACGNAVNLVPLAAWLNRQAADDKGARHQLSQGSN
jgi:hypothetical protein